MVADLEQGILVAQPDRVERAGNPAKPEILAFEYVSHARSSVITDRFSARYLESPDSDPIYFLRGATFLWASRQPRALTPHASSFDDRSN